MSLPLPSLPCLALTLVLLSILVSAAPLSDEDDAGEIYSILQRMDKPSYLKRTHAFGDIGNSLGGRAKLRFGKRSSQYVDPALTEYKLASLLQQYMMDLAPVAPSHI